MIGLQSTRQNGIGGHHHTYLYKME